VTVSIENSITYPAAIHVGDVLTVARGTPRQASSRLQRGSHEPNGDVVAAVSSTAFKTAKEHVVTSDSD
jgi:hypothetical protein